MPSTYKGQNVSISYDETVCTHAGECVRGLPKVFNPERDPGSSLATSATKRPFPSFNAARAAP